MGESDPPASAAPPDRAPVVGLVDYYTDPGARLADLPLADLKWPLGRPGGLEGLTVADLGPEDQLFTYPRLWAFRRQKGVRARLSLMIVEPRAFHWHFMALARLAGRRFHRVLTCDARLLAALPNAEFFVFGNTWVPHWREVDVTKTRMLSLIASKKKALRGHKLRHRIAGWMRAQGIEGDIIGGAYAPFEDKADGLAPYRYSVVIENSREPHLISEKLIDALLLKTVPIYWGATEVARHFDPEGMILCESEEDIRRAITGISAEDYARRLPAIEANREAATRYADMSARAARLLAGTL